MAVDTAAATSEFVTCPECGTSATDTLNRREAGDFCRNCDYPLFWTPTVVPRTYAGSVEASLRRLPGTVGRVTVASLACPHCAEPNAVSATVCVRCGGLLHPLEVLPSPREPVYAPAPPEPVYVEPERRVPWWLWLIVGLVMGSGRVDRPACREHHRLIPPRVRPDDGRGQLDVLGASHEVHPDH